MSKKFQNILFTDIETVPGCQSFNFLGAIERDLFQKKFKSKFEEASNVEPALSNEAIWENVYQDNAALHAEFNRIVSVGLGYIGDQNELRIKCIVNRDEVVILNEVIRVMSLNNFTKIAGHNSDGFDFPVMCRRMVINRLRIPEILDPTGKKSWELSWLDTMKHWGFSEWNHKCSMERLCHVLGVRTPKGEMNGSQVKDFFYGKEQGPEDLPFGVFDKEEARFATIATYQAGDIEALVNCFLRLNNEMTIQPENIKLV